jgi:hypothetical protein
VRERVHALRPVERNGRDGLIDLIQQLLAHPCSFLCSIVVPALRGQARP